MAGNIAEKEKIERLKAGHRGVVTRHIYEAETILEHRREPGHVNCRSSEQIKLYKSTFARKTKDAV